MVAPMTGGLVDIPEEKAAKFKSRGFRVYEEPKPEKPAKKKPRKKEE